MKVYKYILLIFVSALFVNGSCEHKEEQCFIIQNNSDREIIIDFSRFASISQDTVCIKPITKFEYDDFIRDRMIKPHSNKNFENVGNSILKKPQDTQYIGVFYRVDMDTMSCEEFKQKYPLKKEWTVTLTDMEVCNWTLIYMPEE
jgi:hypothetical protein